MKNTRKEEKSFVSYRLDGKHTFIGSSWRIDYLHSTAYTYMWKSATCVSWTGAEETLTYFKDISSPLSLWLNFICSPKQGILLYFISGETWVKLVHHLLICLLWLTASTTEVFAYCSSKTYHKNTVDQINLSWNSLSVMLTYACLKYKRFCWSQQPQLWTFLLELYNAHKIFQSAQYWYSSVFGDNCGNLWEFWGLI